MYPLTQHLQHCCSSLRDLFKGILLRIEREKRPITGGHQTHKISVTRRALHHRAITAAPHPMQPDQNSQIQRIIGDINKLELAWHKGKSIHPPNQNSKQLHGINRNETETDPQNEKKKWTHNKKVEDKTRLSRKKNNFRLPQFTSDWKGWGTDTETRPEGVVTARVLDGRFPSAAQH